MRKFLMLTLLTVFALVAWDTDSSASWRRRCRRYCPRETVVVCAPAPYPAMAPARPAAAQIQIVATRPFTSPKGRVYRVHLTSYQDRHEEAQVQAGPAISPLSTSDDFLGKDRKAAKTSIATGAPQPYATIDDILASLPSDRDMMNDPEIT